MNKIFLFGKNGQIGFELQRVLAPIGNLFAFGRDNLDLNNLEKLRKLLKVKRPDIIVNAAAYTNVDQAEREPEKAMRINCSVPKIMAEEANRIGSLLIHYSTDYVFNGESQCPYTEDDTPSPINVYGRTKLAGEEAISKFNGIYIILRTSWVYGMRGRNFLRAILRLSKEREQIEVVKDQTGTPNWCTSIAETTAIIISSIVLNKNWHEKAKTKTGIYNYSANGYTNWFEFAEAILATNPNKNFCKIPTLIPINSNEYPYKARRPKYSVLSTNKLKKNFNITPLHWKSELILSWKNKH